MSYLARLKAKLCEKPLPPEPPKLTKGASVSFVSNQGGRFCWNAPGEGALREALRDAIEERRAIIAETCPPPYADTVARLSHQKPFAVSAEEWERAVNDAGLFIDVWGALAADLQWTAADLFDVPIKNWPGGLIWGLKGEHVETLGSDHARLGDGRMIVKGEERK